MCAAGYQAVSNECVCVGGCVFRLHGCMVLCVCDCGMLLMVNVGGCVKD